MNHEEPRRDILPSRLADVAPTGPAAAVFARAERFDAGNRFDSTAYGSRGSAAEWIGRAFRRHWWQILPLWGIAAALVWLGLPRWFPNTYEATSVVQVDPGTGAGGMDKSGGADFATFRETQQSRIVAPNVVKAAIERNPNLGRQLAIDARTDPESAILGGIVALLRPKTNLIQVTMTAPKDDGLAAIVDGVIRAYLNVATRFNEEGVAQQSYRLGNIARQKMSQVKTKRDDVARMVAKLGAIDANQGREQHKAAIDDRAALADQLLKTDLEVTEEQARLDRLHVEEAAQAEAMAKAPVTRAPSEADAIAAFYRLPEVIAVTGPLDDVRRKLELANREPGKAAGAAARQTLQPRADDLQRQVDNLWFKLKPGLMVAAQVAPRERPPLESSKLAVRLEGLKARQALLKSRLEALTRDTLAGGSEVLALEYARQDLRNAEALVDAMTPTMSQNEVIANQPVARFNQEYPAKTTEKSQSVPRWIVGTTVPLLAFLGLLGIFGLIERRTGRILDPSDLPAKARLNVIGLVPPLPRSRPGRMGLTSGARQRSQMDFERFIQSLDQLRVLVCGRGDGQGRLRRSLLITSASANEGKSTLAAQLAERSANAGLLTLLIDADLRNPTLSRMFDRPESVGLANVLRGELLAEEAIGTVPEAGGFHFLAAGSVRDDLSRLLASDRLARLLESARESFDLVLVDSPPVLPVADALTIGQWVDGAILTVRHKVSRLPLVDRASRQLASVGITIIGAVVSGVRDRHAPYYGSQPSSDPERPSSGD